MVTNQNYKGKLKLVEGCSYNGFKALERYYGCGEVEINDNNCIEIMKICAIYEEEYLFKECEKYYLIYIVMLLYIKILKML